MAKQLTRNQVRDYPDPFPKETLATVSVDDNAGLVTVTLAFGYHPALPIVRGWHELAGNLGYGIVVHETRPGQ